MQEVRRWLNASEEQVAAATGAGDVHQMALGIVEFLNEDLHHFVAQVDDDLDGDATGLGLSKGREVSLFSVAYASALISALSVLLAVGIRSSMLGGPRRSSPKRIPILGPMYM